MLRVQGGVSARLILSGGVMGPELTIVIPAKNEVEMLPRLLESLCRQDYVGMSATRVLVADAGSTDGTVEVALGFRDRLKVEVVPGGLPSVGRNAGARLAITKYVLFLDADVELPEPTLLRRALWRMERRGLHLATTNIACREGRFFDDVLYAGNNLMQRVGSFTKPFATGMFMLFNREAFWGLGGFNERALFAEDYLLSKGVAPRLGGGEAGGGEDFFVEGDEEAFGAGEDSAVGTLDFGLMEELAVGGAVGLGGAVEMAGDEDQRLIERHGPEVIDLHVAGHGEDVERAIELAHGLVEERGDDASVDVAGRAFMHAIELDVCGGGDVVGVGCVGGEGEVQALGVGGAAAEAVVGALVDGGGVH